MPEHRPSILGACGDAGPEGLQPEGVDVHPASYGRVGGVQQLEAAVDEEAVDPLGADASADHVGGLEHHDIAAGVDQSLGAAQPGKTCSDDHHVDFAPCLHVPTLVRRPTRTASC